MSTVVSVPFASSTVMTPSFFTFFMASAIRRPMASSLFADTRATSSIFLKSSPTSSGHRLDAFHYQRHAFVDTALDVHGVCACRYVLEADGDDGLCQYGGCGCAVAGIVACLDATSLTSCAPMFWKGSSSSISRATLTPSFVIWGAPNFLSIITLRPFGPSVTLTASASASTPFFELFASLDVKFYFFCHDIPSVYKIVKTVYCWFSLSLRGRRSAA